MLSFNTWRPEQNGCHFADNILQMHFLENKIVFWIQIWLKFDAKGPTEKSKFVWVMSWHLKMMTQLTDGQMHHRASYIKMFIIKWKYYYQ